ncbi:MAG TPA: MFS transporter [Candidatus Limnocylindrales bacterium]|nr:MFS transporter [Candidatus Limnocylindrales bacterium]
MADVPVARPFGVRDLLRLPDFRRLYLAQAISDVGDGMTYLALFLLVLDQTGSTAALALMSILVALPPVTIGLFAGAWADRSDRRRIMVVSDTLRAVVVLGLVPAAIAGSLPVIFVLAATQAVLGTFFAPARTALVPRVVPAEGLLAANSLGQMTRMVAGVIGAGITGVIAGVAGVAWPVFAVDAVTFLLSVLLVLRVSREIGRPEAATRASIAARGMGGAVLDGLRLIARSAPLVAALGGVAVTMLGIGAINVLFIPFLVDDLGASPAWAGPIEAAQTIAMVAAGGLLAGLAPRLGVPRLFVGGLVGLAASVGLLALAPGPVFLLLVMFGAGAFTMPVQATTMTIVQSATTDATRGRVAGALNAAIQTASIGSMAAAGILADVIGIRSVFAIGAAMTLVAAATAWALFRRAPAEAAEAGGSAAEVPAAA